MLADLLRRQIAERGPIPFREYMELALYHPDHGYYTSGRARIGRKGDYFTSVSVGPLYGKLLARQIAEVWELLGRPATFDLIEQGAHDGTLASDILSALPGDLPVRLTLVDPSPDLRRQQAEKLSGAPVRWVDSVGQLDPFTGMHLSNELIDAFPVHLVHRTEGGWMERAVTCAGGAFGFTDIPLTVPALGDSLPDLPVGYITEVNLAARTWIAELAPRVERGVVLAIDYGYARQEYYAPHRVTGTLEAIAHHRRVDPLTEPGEADITAHVDFTSVAEASGLEVLGYTDQHHLMVGLAKGYFAEGVRPDPQEMRAFQTLSHPTLLGRSFKALALGRGVPAQLSAFAFAREPLRELGLAGGAD